MGLGATGAWLSGSAPMVEGTESFPASGSWQPALPAAAQPVLTCSRAQGQPSWLAASSASPESKGLEFPAGSELCAARCPVHGRGGGLCCVTPLPQLLRADCGLTTMCTFPGGAPGHRCNHRVIPSLLYSFQYFYSSFSHFSFLERSETCISRSKRLPQS